MTSMCSRRENDPLVDEALAAFASDLGYATSLVQMHISSGSWPPADRPVLVEWGSPPIFVEAADVPAEGDPEEPPG